MISEALGLAVLDISFATKHLKTRATERAEDLQDESAADPNLDTDDFRDESSLLKDKTLIKKSDQFLPECMSQIVEKMPYLNIIKNPSKNPIDPNTEADDLNLINFFPCPQLLVMKNILHLARICCASCGLYSCCSGRESNITLC